MPTPAAGAASGAAASSGGVAAVGWSLAVHAILLAAFGFALPSHAATLRPVVVSSVEASMFTPEGAVPAAETPVPEVVVEASCTQDQVESPEPPAALAEAWPERAAPTAAEPCAAARPFDPLARIRPVVQPSEPPVVPPTETTPPPEPAAAEAPPAEAGAEARAAVPVPLPGHNPAPEYPERARRRRLEGTVVVRIAVGGDGGNLGCEVATSSGVLDLDRAALAAAQKWRFDCGPGAVEVPFVFRLREP